MSDSKRTTYKQKSDLDDIIEDDIDMASPSGILNSKNSESEELPKEVPDLDEQCKKRIRDLQALNRMGGSHSLAEDTFPKSKRRMLDLVHPAADGWATGINQDGFYEANRFDPDTGCIENMVMQPLPVQGNHPWYIRTSGTLEQMTLRERLDEVNRPRRWWERVGQWMGLMAKPELSKADQLTIEQNRALHKAVLRAGEALDAT